MKLYADLPARRLAPADRRPAARSLWVVGSVLLARLVHDAVMLLAEPGRAGQRGLRRPGRAVPRGRQRGRRGAAWSVTSCSAPFDGAGDAADQLAAAGPRPGRRGRAAGVLARAGDRARSRSCWRWRLRAAALARSRATPAAGQRFVDAAEDLDLFALRALAHQPLHRLARISDDPAGAWRRGERSTVVALARLELREVGLRPPGDKRSPVPIRSTVVDASHGLCALVGVH